MTINIQSVHFDADKKLLDFITDKAEKLSTFYDGIINCEVTLRLDKSSNSENKIAEIKLLGAAKALQYAYRGCVPPGPEPVLPVP